MSPANLTSVSNRLEALAAENLEVLIDKIEHENRVRVTDMVVDIAQAQPGDAPAIAVTATVTAA